MPGWRLAQQESELLARLIDQGDYLFLAIPEDRRRQQQTSSSLLEISLMYYIGRFFTFKEKFKEKVALGSVAVKDHPTRPSCAKRDWFG
jgi:hypothetical protein